MLRFGGGGMEVVGGCVFFLGLLCCSLAVETRLNGSLIHLTGSDGGGDSGGKTRGSDTGFWFGKEKVTWDKARSYCQQAGLTLLVIQTELKQKKFEAYLDETDETGDWSSGGAWLAGTDRRNETGGLERFYWAPTSSETIKMSYQNFGNPSHGCVVVSNGVIAFGKWFVKDCSYETVYFCESRV